MTQPPRWLGIAGVVEPTAYLIALFLYLLPFVQPIPGAFVQAVPGVLFALLSLFLLVVSFWPSGLLFFGAYGLPLVAAISGLSLQRAARLRGAAWRFVVALVGSTSMFLGVLGHPSGWAFAYYAAVAALAVATVAAAVRLFGALKDRRVARWERDEPMPAPSAQQELMRKSRS